MATPPGQELTRDTKADIDSFIQTTRILYWHEAPLPQLFIVLPTTNYTADRLQVAPGPGKISILLDLLELVRPQALFEKYGDYLLQTVLMVKYGRLKTGSLKTPYLSFQSQTGLDHVPGIQILQTGLPRQNALMRSRQLNGGRLTVNSMAIWGLTSPYIKMYLAKNPGLASLDLQCPLEDFEKAEQFLIQTFLYPASGCGNNGGYLLQEFTLRDTRGRNDISARYILPAYSPSQLMERSSVKMLVNMVLVEKTDPGYHSIFWAHGHAVKSLILTQDTASTILPIHYKATANLTPLAQHSRATTAHESSLIAEGSQHRQHVSSPQHHSMVQRHI
ncbi:hypothetical protein F5H01DRAFT_371071 [Linnemannia elongata]|nr:hypothetical protein F5H01DRAFT_371071 [Linnemannia elongata]